MAITPLLTQKIIVADAEKETKKRGYRRGKVAKTGDGRRRLTEQRGAKTLVTGLLGFFSLDTLVDLFTMHGDFFRGINANTYLVTLHP